MSTWTADGAAMRARVEQYVRRETPTGDAVALEAFLDLVAEGWAGTGAVSGRERVDGVTHLVVDVPGSAGRTDEAPVLCLAHHDTVWPAGTLGGAVPLREEGGVLHGPGVYDMKGGLVVLETAVRAVLAGPHRPVRVVVVGDEEVGSPTARELVADSARAAVAVLGFEPPHPDGALKTARWGSTRLRLGVTGRESHAALAPGDGVSAVDELVDQLVGVRAVAARHPGALCNAGTIGGGGRTNVVAGQAWADLGLRFADPATERAVLAELAGAAPVRDGAVLRTEVLAQRPAWTADGDAGALLAVAQAAGRAVGQQVTGRPARGAADTNLTGALGVPTLDGLGPPGRGAHAPDEQIVLSGLAERAQLVAALLALL